MDQFMEFLRQIFTKIEVVIPTLVTILGSSGSIIAYKFAKLLASTAVLRGEISSCKKAIDQLKNLLDNQRKAIEERDALLNDIIEANPNQRFKKQTKERMQTFTKLESCNQEIIETPVEQKKKKVKVKHVKKA